MIKKIALLSLWITTLSSAPGLSAQPTEDLSEMSLEQLLNVNIIGASKYEQKQSAVAAAVSVINHNEIKAFGWRTLNDALS